MFVGVLREIKEDERRVALQPFQARLLGERGHKVYVEEGAGVGAGFADTEYAANGASVVSKATVLERCTLLLKVKAPMPAEYGDYRDRHTLFTYLHFDENISASNILSLIRSGFLGLAYEWVGENGHYPLLQPMSRLTGYLFAQKALEICAREKGVFCAANEDFLPAGRGMIVGLGNIGLSAFRFLSDLKVQLVVVANSTADEVNRRANERFETREVDYIARAKASFIRMDTDDPDKTRAEIAAHLPKLDILINCAVRRPSFSKAKLSYLIDAPMIAAMERNSVVCDATANDKDLIETCVSSASLDKTYTESGVVHYNCDHIPALVARTATELLTEHTFPYVMQLADRGVIDAIRHNGYLANAACCYRGHVTHSLSAEKKDLPYQPIQDLLHETYDLVS